MGSKGFFIRLFCTVLMFVYAQPRNVNVSLRNKRDNRWVWGYAEDINLNKNRTNTFEKQQCTKSPSTINLDIKNDACKYERTKPNFDAPGRKISETKCYSYIWQAKCYEENKRRNGGTPVRPRPKSRPGEFSIAAIGGRDTTEGEFPHMAAVGWKTIRGTWVFKCGGSLISPNFVLTAAHCTKVSAADTSVDGLEPKIVRLGDKNILDINENGQLPLDVNINKLIPHPEYKAPSKYYDIALLKLEREVAFTEFIRPGCLWSKLDTSELGTKATLTGWGVKEITTREVSVELQAAVVKIIEPAQCNDLLRFLCNRHWCGMKDQICAGELLGGIDACQGDSGGPLQVLIDANNVQDEKIRSYVSVGLSMHHIIGVTSFGFGCARADTPGIYTRVASFIGWIEDIVWGH